MSLEFKKHLILWQKEVFSCRIFSAIESLVQHAVQETEASIYTLQFSDWVNVIPVTADGKIVLVRQHRFGTNKVTLETPGGAVDAHEKDLTMAALRELEEETGLSTKKILALPGYAPNPAVQNNRITYFLALDVQPVEDRKHFPDDFEHLEMELMSVDDALSACRNGTMGHALAALGILLAEPYLRGYLSSRS